MGAARVPGPGTRRILKSNPEPGLKNFQTRNKAIKEIEEIFNRRKCFFYSLKLSTLVFIENLPRNSPTLFFDFGEAHGCTVLRVRELGQLLPGAQELLRYIAVLRLKLEKTLLQLAVSQL